MKLSVFLERENKQLEVEANSIKEILDKLNVNKEAVIIVINNELSTEDSKIKDKDDIKFLSVISGG